MTAELTDDEYTVLTIAASGESMMPIGRWAQPVESLVQKGLLSCADKFNNYITEAGRQAITEREKADINFIGAATSRIETSQAAIRDFAEQAAQLLAEAARTSARLTGDTPETAASRWSTVILNRTQEILRGQ